MFSLVSVALAKIRVRLPYFFLRPHSLPWKKFRVFKRRRRLFGIRRRENLSIFVSVLS